MRRKWYLSFVLAVLLCFTLALPAIGAENNSLVTAAELNSLLETEDVVIVDVRDNASYEAGHIPGAVSIQKTDYYETIDEVNSMAAGPELFSATLSRIGADKNSRIIVYTSANDLTYATRFWWVLHTYGHENSQVLDGGIDAWTAAGYELSAQPAAPAPTEYSLTANDVNPDAVATNEEVIAAQAANQLLVDARDNDYFYGKKTKVARSGHISEAIQIDAKEHLNADGTFKTKEELAKLYADRNITADTPVIIYCNTGTSATANYFALTQILGYTQVQNYDASLTYWASDPNLPMESNYDFFTIGSDKAEVNATFMNLSAAPCLKDDRSFAPADALAAGLGAQLTTSDNTITLTANNVTVQLTLGDTVLKNNGTDQQIDVAPFTVDGVNLLPIRWVAEAFGAEIGWDAEKQQVSVSTK